MDTVPQRSPSKKLFLIVSLFFIVMTIALTVVQTRQEQDTRSSAAADFTNCGVSDELIANDAEERDLLQLINEFRAERDLEPLEFNQYLNRAAAWKSKDMATTNTMDHTDSFDRDVDVRLMQCGYRLKRANENIGQGQETAQQIFTAWKNSEGHKDAMLCNKEKCEDVGIARDRKNGGEWFWTMNAGILLEDQQNPPPSNNNPTATPSASLTASPSAAITQTPTLPPAQTTLPDGTTGVLATVVLPGIGKEGTEAPLHPNRLLTVTIRDPERKEVAKVDSIMSYNQEKHTFFGAVALPDTISSGTYIIELSTDHSIARIASSGFLSLEKGKALTLPTVTVPAVDLDGNGTVSITDVFYFRNCLEDQDCEPSETDLNDDGEENIADYSVFLDVFGNYTGE